MALTVIKGGGKPRGFRAENKDDLEPMRCPECDSAVFEEIIVNPMRRNLKWDRRTGTRKLRCANSACKVICD